MGVFNKLKEVLFDVEEEIPVIEKEEKKVVREPKVEENPIKEIKMPQDDLFNDFDIDKTEEIPVVKKESNFNFPLDFEEELPKRSTKKDLFDEEFTLGHNYKETKKEEPIKKKDEYSYDYSRLDIKESKKEDIKGFKPSPIISPVYGILDQNYTKDDVIVKNDGLKRTPNLDDVRKKAYSHKQKKEDEALKTIDDLLKEEVIEEEQNNTIEDEITDDFINDNELSSREVSNYDDNEEESILDLAQKDSTSSDEDEMETDLFNLIDSMYEDKNERDE